MNELLEIYKLDDTFLGSQDRKKFYEDTKKEFREVGLVSKKVKNIHVLLMNSLGRVYLQKRSELKEENPNLYDKTVGGHVTLGNTFELTVIKECVQELGFPVAVLSEEEFKDAIKSIDLKIIGVLKKIDYIPKFESLRIQKNGSRFVQSYMTEVYVGYYDGAIRFIDGESCGIETFSIEQLKKSIEESPSKFTEDIKFMINKYSDFLTPIDVN